MSEIKVNSIKGVGASTAAININNSDGTATANLTNRHGKNLVINGAMLIAQAGTSSTGQLYSTVDRIRSARLNTDEAPTYEQANIAAGTTPYTLGFRKAYSITNGNQTSGAQAGDKIAFSTRLEAKDIATSGWNYTSTSSYVTIQFWVKSSVAQNFYFSLTTDDGTSKSYIMETGSLTADTWTKVTKTISGHADLQFDMNREKGLTIDFSVFRGTNETASGVTLNQWADFNQAAKVPDMTSTWYTTNDATFQITGLQLEVSDHATDFEHLPMQEHLFRCQRYYQQFDGSATAWRLGTGMSSSATNGMLLIKLNTPMRQKPTAISHSGTASDYQVHFSSVVNCSAVPTVHSQSTPEMARVDLEVPSGTFSGGGDFFIFRANNVNAFIGLRCEI